MKRKIQNFTKVITTEFAGAVKEGKSYHLTPSPSPYRGEGSRVKSRLTFKKRSAFTLAETLITVVILGILAAILVPNLIKNQVENANRTKVKKAMAAYEKAINYMIIENDIKSTENLRELGQDNCQYTREYFKTVQDGINNCIFKTADRVWWDITDITNPIISLKDEITDSNKAAIRTNALSLETDKTSFALIGRFDDLGTLRVNDNAYEQGLENNLTNQAYMIKLWHFINNNSNYTFIEQFRACKASRAASCTISLNGVNTTYTRITTTTDTTVNQRGDGKDLPLYDRNTRTWHGGGDSVASAGDYYISESLGAPTEEEAKNMSGSVCGKKECDDNGDYYEAAKRKCKAQGAHLATLGELKIAYNNGKLSEGWFWASEEYFYNLGYAMDNTGFVRANSKYGSYSQVVCVADD